MNKVSIEECLPGLMPLTIPIQGDQFLQKIQVENLINSMEEQLLINGQFNLNEAYNFLERLKQGISETYLIDSDLSIGAGAALRHLINNEKFTEEEIDLGRQFYDELISLPDREVAAFALFKRKNNHKEPELVLPPKMAVGFCIALAGGLLCVIPGAQIIGGEVIAIGAGIFLDGLANGEKPYFAEPNGPGR